MKDKQLIPEEVMRVLEQILKVWSRESDICPYCQTTIKTMIQNGRCVYASSFGCRIGQGYVNEAWKQDSETPNFCYVVKISIFTLIILLNTPSSARGIRISLRLPPKQKRV